MPAPAAGLEFHLRSTGELPAHATLLMLVRSGAEPVAGRLPALVRYVRLLMRGRTLQLCVIVQRRSLQNPRVFGFNLNMANREKTG